MVVANTVGRAPAGLLYTTVYCCCTLIHCCCVYCCCCILLLYNCVLLQHTRIHVHKRSHRGRTDIAIVYCCYNLLCTVPTIVYCCYNCILLQQLCTASATYCYYNFTLLLQLCTVATIVYCCYNILLLQYIVYCCYNLLCTVATICCVLLLQYVVYCCYNILCTVATIYCVLLLQYVVYNRLSRVYARSCAVGELRMCGWGPYAREASVWEACYRYPGTVML